MKTKSLDSQVELYELESQPDAAERLTRVANITRVPCLVIEGKPLHESDSIIKWLGENAA